jgi:hypothetical protein
VKGLETCGGISLQSPVTGVSPAMRPLRLGIKTVKHRPKFRKKDYPVSEIRRYLEPGPVVLVSSAWKEHTNIMTMGWHMCASTSFIRRSRFLPSRSRGPSPSL